MELYKDKQEAKMRLIDYIRSILTLLLVCGVYFETGKWTALCFILINMGLEVVILNLRVVMRSVDEILENRK